MEESLKAQRLRGTQNDVLWGAWPPTTECDFEGPHSKISAMGPEFLVTALRAIKVSGPSTVYHLVFTSYSPFPSVIRLKSFSPHGGGRFSIGSSQTSLTCPGHRWCLQCPMAGLYLPYQKNVRGQSWPNGYSVRLVTRGCGFESHKTGLIKT